MLRKALEAEGGVEYLRRVARGRPELFCALIARLIPSEVKASREHSDVPVVEVRDYTGRRPGMRDHTLVGHQEIAAA